MSCSCLASQKIADTNGRILSETAFRKLLKRFTARSFSEAAALTIRAMEELQGQSIPRPVLVAIASTSYARIEQFIGDA